jgi:hypothetical protein
MADGNYAGTYYIVQALLAVNPNHPRWSDVTNRAVNGWNTLPETTARCHGYWFGRWWTDVIAWNDKTVAIEQFALLMQHPQKYQLRLVEVIVSRVETLITAAQEASHE